MKKLLLFITLLSVLSFPVFGEENKDSVKKHIAEMDPDDELLLVDVPVFIGEEGFIKKANERAAKAGREKPLGLVLSGGAARAMAHLGVLQCMEDEGIVPDFFVTNSMGSIIALLYSAGLSCSQITDILVTFPLGTLFLPEIPISGGLLDTSRFISVLYNILGERKLEDLKIPVAVITEDLITRRQIIFQEGDMYDLIQGSIAIPFNFPPKEYMGYLLMDGGCTNLVPVDIACRYTDRVAVSSTLYSKKQNLKNFITIINRMQDVSKTRAGIMELKKYDLVWIRNPVEKYSFMGFDKSDEIVDLGYKCAEEKMEELKVIAAPVHDAEKNDFFEDRDALQKSFDNYCLEHRKKGVISLKDPTVLMTLGFSMLGEVPNDYYLNDYNYLYVGEEFGYNTVRFNAREYWFPENMGVDTSFSFIVGQLLRSKSRGLVNFEDYNLESWYYYSKNEVIFLAYDMFGLNPFVIVEGTLDNSFTADDSFHRFGFDGYVGNDKFIKFSGYGFKENESIDGIGGYFSIHQHLVWDLYFNQRTVYRMPMDGNNKINLYKNDGVRGKTKTGYFDKVLATNNTFYFAPDFAPSLAEAFIFSNCMFGVFGDFYLLDEYFFSAGLAMDFNISFIGLKPIKFLWHSGWDFQDESFFMKFAIGTEF